MTTHTEDDELRKGDDLRDTELGAALLDLETPEHAQAFFADLERDMTAIDRRRVSPPHPQPAWRRWFGGWRFVAVPVAAATLLAVLWVWGGPASPTRLWDDLAVKPASAAEITAKMRAALAAASSLAGELVVISPDGIEGAAGEMRWRFATSARGDFLYSGANTLADGSVRTETIAYDAATGTERGYSQDGVDGPVFAGERVGLAAGPPDQGPSDWVLQRQLGSVVRALTAAQSDGSVTPTVAEATYEGRPAWVLDTPVRRNLIAGLSGDRLEVTVDQETGFPVRSVETLGGTLVQETRLEGLTVGSTDTDYSVTFPEGAEVTHTDVGFTRIDAARVVAEAPAVVGYPPLLPGWAPEGYAPAEAALAESALPTGVEGMNPESRGVVSLIYRRGFDRFVITTRLVGDDPGAWSDPLASGEGYRDEPQTVTLSAGPFAGSPAELLVDPRATPHLWAMDGTLVLTISGDLSREELIRVAESLTTVAPPPTG